MSHLWSHRAIRDDSDAAKDPVHQRIYRLALQQIAAVISDEEIWRAALAMVKRYGADATLESAARADQLLEEGDSLAAANWHRILKAIERLQAKAPTEGEKVH